MTKNSSPEPGAISAAIAGATGPAPAKPSSVSAVSGDFPTLTSAEFLRDPYPAWAHLRRHAPVHFSAEWNAFLLTRYSDVAAGFRDPRLTSNRIAAYAANLPPPVQQVVAPLVTHFSHWILFADPPMHTRVRGLINRAFVPRIIESMRPRLAQLVDDLMARLPDGPVVDVVAALAVPLPVLAIGEMLGLPASDRHLLKGWSDMLAAFLGMRKPTPEFVAHTISAVADLERYFRDLIAQRRRRPTAQEDVLTGLLSAEENGALLSEQELLSTCSAVLFGGHETTTNLITNMVLMLTRFPQAQADLRRDFASVPSAIPSFVEETLRFESPVQRMGRTAGEDFELHGVPIKKGQVVWLGMGAANRDPEQFADADSFLPRRTDNRHLAFGLGHHFCIGAALGRMEAQLALGGLLRALPTIKLADEPIEWIDNLTVHGVKRLPIVRP